MIAEAPGGQLAKTTGKIDTAKLAYEGIRQMLFNNEIVPGQKISYSFIAERLNMSLTPIIQALNRLEYQGIVHREPNRGYFTEAMSTQEVEEIYDLREVIELPLLPLVIKNLDAAAIKKLKSILRTRPSHGSELSLNDRLTIDRDFHSAIISLSQKKTQLMILNYLYDLLYLKYHGSLMFVAQKEVVGSQHEIIMEALVSKDIRKARKAVKDHYKYVKRKALAALTQMLDERNLSNI